MSILISRIIIVNYLLKYTVLKFKYTVISIASLIEIGKFISKKHNIYKYYLYLIYNLYFIIILLLFYVVNYFIL